MQKNWLNFMYKISLLFFAINIWSADNSAFQVSDFVQNIQMVTQGQQGQEQINSLEDLEKVFGSAMNALVVDMNNYSTQELKSLAFGGYTFIDNPFNKSAGVSLNILKELLPLNFQEMTQEGTNSIYIGLFGQDASGNLLTNLYQGLQQNNTTNSLDHFNLYIFNNQGALLGNPLYVPLNKYYSYREQQFIIPNFSQASEVNSTVSNFDILINGQNLLEQSNITYPYLINIQNISGIDIPNKYLNYQEITAVLPSLSDPRHQISSSYQTLDSLEIIIGNKAFSFNQNSINQSTEIAKNGICADISRYTTSLENSGMIFIFAAVGVDGNIITNSNSGQSKIQVPLSHYLLFIFDNQQNLVKGIYVNPEYSTDASYFKITQDPNEITVRINGNSITQGQQYSYPIRLNLSYGSGVQLPALSSITNKIRLKGSESLSSLIYNLTSSGQTAALDFSSSTLFGFSWLDTINEWLDMGQALLINTEQSYSGTGSGNSTPEPMLVLTVYSIANDSQIMQQVFELPKTLSDLTISYQLSSSNQKSSSQATQTLTVDSTNLDNNWIAIIPSGKIIPKQALTASSLQKFANHYENLKAFLNINKILLYSTPVNAFATAKTMPGWYDKASKRYSYQGFNLQLDQMKSGEGYFFVEDTANKNQKKFSGTSGVAGLFSGSKILQELEKTIVPQGTCIMVLLAFDAQGNYIPDIIKTTPDHFDLYIFDAKGNNLASSPITFKATDYVGLGNYQLLANPQSPATFVLNGMGVKQIKSLTYPFAAKISWNVSSKLPKHKKTPKKIPTIPPIVLPVSYDDLSTLTLSMLKTKVSSITTVTVPAQDDDFEVEGFSFIIGQKKCAFISDPSKIVPLTKGSEAYQNLLNTMNSGPNPELTLVIFQCDDSYKNIYGNISTESNTFALFAYGADGTILPGYPLKFASNTLTTNSNNQVAFEGLGAITSQQTLKYPFALTVKWVENGTITNNHKINKGDSFAQLWIEPSFSSKDFARIEPVYGAGMRQGVLANALYNNIGFKNVLLKTTVVSDTVKHYALIKGYVKDSTNYYCLISDPIIFSWPIGTSAIISNNFSSTVPYLNTYQNNQVPVILTTAFNDRKIRTKTYQSNTNGKLLVEFQVS